MTVQLWNGDPNTHRIDKLLRALRASQGRHLFPWGLPGHWVLLELNPSAAEIIIRDSLNDRDASSYATVTKLMRLVCGKTPKLTFEQVTMQRENDCGVWTCANALEAITGTSVAPKDIREFRMCLCISIGTNAWRDPWQSVGERKLTLPDARAFVRND
jgi:hypothetical protein